MVFTLLLLDRGAKRARRTLEVFMLDDAFLSLALLCLGAPFPQRTLQKVASDSAENDVTVRGGQSNENGWHDRRLERFEWSSGGSGLVVVEDGVEETLRLGGTEEIHEGTIGESSEPSNEALKDC